MYICIGLQGNLSSTYMTYETTMGQVVTTWLKPRIIVLVYENLNIKRATLIKRTIENPDMFRANCRYTAVNLFALENMKAGKKAWKCLQKIRPVTGALCSFSGLCPGKVVEYSKMVVKQPGLKPGKSVPTHYLHRWEDALQADFLRTPLPLPLPLPTNTNCSCWWPT